MKRHVDPAVLAKVAEALTVSPGDPPAVQPVSDPPVPAGFTYLGQFVDHDLTEDVTDAALGDTRWRRSIWPSCACTTGSPTSWPTTAYPAA